MWNKKAQYENNVWKNVYMRLNNLYDKGIMPGRLDGD